MAFAIHDNWPQWMLDYLERTIKPDELLILKCSHKFDSTIGEAMGKAYAQQNDKDILGIFNGQGS